MTKINKVLEERNKLLVKVLWGSLVLALITDIAAGVSKEVIYLLAGVGSAVCVLTTYLTYKKLYVDKIKYIVVIGLAILTYFMVKAAPNTVSYLMVFYILAVASLYQIKGPIILSAIISLIFTNYWFFAYQEEMFTSMGTIELVSLNLFVILVSALLIVQSGFSESLRKQTFENEQKALEKVELLDNKIKTSLKFLKSFSEEVSNTSGVSTEITNDITISFKDIALAIENQASSVDNISVNIHETEENLNLVAEASSSMNELSMNTKNVVNEGNDKMTVLIDKSRDVNKNIKDTSIAINELNDYSQEINDILSTITSIAGQTNLLALNAGIEAARAGEHGRGFSVVAEEIRDLAETSQKSSEEIAQILKQISINIGVIAQHINKALDSVGEEQDISTGVKESFVNILDNTDEVVDQSNKINQMIMNLEGLSRDNVDKISNISGTTEETSASIQEVLASMETQNDIIKDNNDNVKKLKETIRELNDLVE
ncbi:methyl-accepting chemotaxis protein [Natronospora cellulosivora (SeqCode)]